jgi:cation:H+ antiporter
MQDILFNLGGFLLCAVIIFYAGKKLAFYGDLLADISGMGKAFVGLILMAAITSLPELMVGLSSAGILQSADLAVGDVLGSCAFNLGILSLMDIFTPKSNPLYKGLSKSHLLAATFGIILVSLTGLSLFLDEDIVLIPSLGLTSISFALIYFLSMRTLYAFRKFEPAKQQPEHPEYQNWTLKKVLIRFILFATIIVIVALALPYFADQIAQITGLGQIFVGTLFLAVSTSLPEVAVSISAVRMGSPDIAVGNLLGSNIFNIFILFLDDIFYTKGHLLKDTNDVNLVSVLFILIMTAVAIIAFTFPIEKKKLFMAWASLAIFILYALNISLLYYLR